MDSRNLERMRMAGPAMLDPRASAIAAGLVSGATAAAIAAAHALRPGYGASVVALLTDLHPTLVPGAGAPSVVALGLLALVDGAAVGYVGAWLYNRFAHVTAPPGGAAEDPADVPAADAESGPP